MPIYELASTTGTAYLDTMNVDFLGLRSMNLQNANRSNISRSNVCPRSARQLSYRYGLFHHQAAVARA